MDTPESNNPTTDYKVFKLDTNGVVQNSALAENDQSMIDRIIRFVLAKIQADYLEITILHRPYDTLCEVVEPTQNFKQAWSWADTNDTRVICSIATKH